MKPVQTFNEFLVEMTDQFTVCKSTTFAKQVSTRTSSFSGLFDMGGTIFTAILKNYLDPGDNELANGFNDYFSAASCAKTSRSLGKMLSQLVNTKIPDEFYKGLLTYDLQAETGYGG